MPHVPQSPTTALRVLTFDEALVPSPDAAYDRSRWFYVPDFYSEYRYILGTRGTRPLIAVGINPSTAAPDALDNTLKSVERIALANGYDCFWMFNVYAQRATDPDHMEPALNPVLHRENLRAFSYLLDLARGVSGAVPDVWAAWGTILLKRAYLPGCVRDMASLGQKAGARWFTCGPRSKNGGHPHHPLYLRRDARLDPFDVEAYLASLPGEK